MSSWRKLTSTIVLIKFAKSISLSYDEKIIFKQFRVNEKIQDFLYDIESAKENRKGKIRPLQEYYLMMKNKKMIIKEIKNNLLDQHG